MLLFRQQDQRGRFVFLLILSLLYIPLSFAESQKKLHVGISLRPVFQYALPGKSYSGLDVELGKAIASEAGYQLEMLDYPWSRIIHSIEAGKIDLTFTAANTDVRKKFALFSREYLRYGHNKFYVLNRNLPRFKGITSLEDLKGLSIIVGVQRGYEYSDEYGKLLREDWFAERLQVFNNSNTKLESILKGRIDAFVGSEYGTTYLLNQRNVSNEIASVFYLEPDDDKTKTYMMFSKKSVSQQVVDDFDAAIKRLRETGKLQEITQSYLNPE